MTAPTHLTDADREALSCSCRHGLIWHHENRGCGYHGYSDGRCGCGLRFDDAHKAIVQRAVTAALNDAADAIEAERRSLDKAGHISFATGCYRAERIVRART